MTRREWKDREARQTVATTVFESFTEMLDFIQTRPPGGLGSSHRRSSLAEEHKNGWYMSKDMEEAQRLAREGWPEGREIVQAITAKFENITASKIMRPQVAYDVAGDCVDVGRYVTGEPECMMIFEEVETDAPGKIIRMEVNLMASSGISPHQLAVRGAAACALVDALEQCGKSVELVVSWANSHSDAKRRAEGYCPVKSAGEPLEMDRLAFMLAHASMLRRMVFGALENDPGWVIGHAQSGYSLYGAPNRAMGGDFAADIVVPEMLLKSTPEACIRWVFKCLKEQGIEIEGA